MGTRAVDHLADHPLENEHLTNPMDFGLGPTVGWGKNPRNVRLWLPYQKGSETAIGGRGAPPEAEKIGQVGRTTG